MPIQGLPDWFQMPIQGNPLAQMLGNAPAYFKEGLDINKQLQELPYAGDQAKANAAYKMAMSQYLNNPTTMLKNVSPLGKSILEPAILPTLSKMLSDKYHIKVTPEDLAGLNAAEGNGTPTANNNNQKIKTMYDKYGNKIASDTKQGEAATAAQNLYNQIEDIDTAPLEAFAGATGKGKGYIEKGKGLLNQLGIKTFGEPSEEFRNYQTWLSVNKNLIIDQLRKALSTSIMPAYVAKTLAPMVDSESAMWSDPKQVQHVMGELKHWSKNYSDEQTDAYTEGVAPTTKAARERHLKHNEKPANELETAINADKPAATHGDKLVHMINEKGEDRLMPEKNVAKALATKKWKRGGG